MARKRRVYSCFLCFLIAIQPGIAVSGENEKLLNCQRYDDEKEFQIYLNEPDAYVIYNAQIDDSYERHREVPIEGSDDTTTIDFGLDITVNNSAFIVARDDMGSLMISKRDASFAYAWVNPVPVGDGEFTAFGNHHEGTCSISPFE